MKKASLYFLTLLLLCCSNIVIGQTVTIMGTVSEQGSELPLLGVNILIDDTSVGTVSDYNGMYTITTESTEGKSLQFSYIGYKTLTVQLTGTDQDLNVEMMEDATSLEQVVILGSSVTQSRKKLGNAVTTLKTAEMLVASPTSVTSALQAKIPGAQITQNSGDPAGGFSVKLRGPSTIKGSSEPLYVIDGVISSNLTTNVTNLNVSSGDASPGQNRMVDINPNDIESINVLNGAAAAAIYGSRASNGVIILTTKRGSEMDTKPKMSFKTTVNVNQVRKKLDLNLTGEEFQTIPNSSLTGRLWPIFGFNPADNSLTPFRYLSTDKFNTTRYDYQDQIFQTGLGTDNYFSIKGGKENLTYFASAGYLSNEGIIKNTKYGRLSARFNLNQIINDWWSYDFGLYYSNSSSDEKPDGNVFWSPINSVNITNNNFDITERDANGNLKAVERTRVNPLSVIETFDITQKVSRVIPSLHVNLYPIENLSIDQTIGMDKYTQEGHILIPIYPYENVNPAYFNNGYLGNAEANVTNWNYDITAAYDKEYDNYGFKTTTGYSFQSSKLTFRGTQGRDLDAAGAPTVELQTNPIDTRLDIYGFFLQETFSYNDKLFITAAGRIDGATNFDVDKRSNFYPKLSGSYILSDGTSSGFFNSARIRASYGEAGNLTAISPYERFGRYSSSNFLGEVTLQQDSRLGNTNLVPERTKEIEIGTDLSFWKNRIAVLFTLYKQDIEDLIVSRVLAPSIGGASRTENVGTMTNKGMELYTRFTAMKTKDMTWDFALNFSKNKNEVISTVGGDITIANSTGAPPVVQEGQPLGVFYGTYFAKDNNGELILSGSSDNGSPEGTPQVERGNLATGEAMRDANGQPTGDVLRKVIGDPNPDYIMGFGTDFRYKKFTFSVLFESVRGFDIFDADKRTRQGVGLGSLAEQELTGELPRGYIAAIYPIQEFRMEDGSFTKLREISIAYTIPTLSNGRISNLRFAFTGRNLYSWDNFFSYDPETNAGGQSNLLRSVNFGNVPIPRTFSFSLSLDF